MLEIDNLSFSRASHRRLTGINLRVAAGEMVKVVGHNGCGKTTLLKRLCYLLPVEEGCIRWHGRDTDTDIAAYQEELLYIGHRNAISGRLTPIENLRAAAALRLRRPLCPLSVALAKAGLREQVSLLCYQLSAGQNRRVALACLCAFQARLWLLDEPLASLDAVGRQLVQCWLAEHLKAGGMAFVTMHQVHDWAFPAQHVLTL